MGGDGGEGGLLCFVLFFAAGDCCACSACFACFACFACLACIACFAFRVLRALPPSLFLPLLLSSSSAAVRAFWPAGTHGPFWGAVCSWHPTIVSWDSPCAPKAPTWPPKVFQDTQNFPVSTSRLPKSFPKSPRASHQPRDFPMTFHFCEAQTYKKSMFQSEIKGIIIFYSWF